MYISAPPTGLLNVWDVFAAGGCVRRFIRCQGEDQGEEAGEEAEEEERGKQESGEMPKTGSQRPQKRRRLPRGAGSGE